VLSDEYANDEVEFCEDGGRLDWDEGVELRDEVREDGVDESESEPTSGDGAMESRSTFMLSEP
jgi:hypothetical protein